MGQTVGLALRRAPQPLQEGVDRHDEQAAAGWAPLRGLPWITFHCQSGSKDRDRAAPALVGSGQEESRTAVLKRNPVLRRKGCRESVATAWVALVRADQNDLDPQRPGSHGSPRGAFL